jgi:hypothetical protein
MLFVSYETLKVTFDKSNIQPTESVINVFINRFTRNNNNK